jgi:hypothetical protein
METIPPLVLVDGQRAMLDIRFPSLSLTLFDSRRERGSEEKEIVLSHYFALQLHLSIYSV